jgi:hypothetical protein
MNIASQKAPNLWRCCHSRMSLSGIQNKALRWFSGTDVALSGYPLKTCLHAEVRRSGTQACGYDKKCLGLAEIFGSRILQDDYMVETRSNCPPQLSQVVRRAKYEISNKSEAQSPNIETCGARIARRFSVLPALLCCSTSNFDLRISNFFRIPRFGFRICGH